LAVIRRRVDVRRCIHVGRGGHVVDSDDFAAADADDRDGDERETRE
jgi:hypothetical protein